MTLENPDSSNGLYSEAQQQQGSLVSSYTF
jgi:hypothetical protein